IALLMALVPSRHASGLDLATSALGVFVLNVDGRRYRFAHGAFVEEVLKVDAPATHGFQRRPGNRLLGGRLLGLLDFFDWSLLQRRGRRQASANWAGDFAFSLWFGRPLRTRLAEIRNFAACGAGTFAREIRNSPGQLRRARGFRPTRLGFGRLG